MAADLDERDPSRFQAVRYECLDAVGHYFLRYAVPGAFGDVSDDGAPALRRRARWPTTRRRTQLLGRAMAALRPGDLLLVVSGFGMEPIERRQAPARARLRQPRAERHPRARAGRLPASPTAPTSRPGGYPRRRSSTWRRPSSTSSACRSARDMDGFARTDIFTPAFTAATADHVHSDVRAVGARDSGLDGRTRARRDSGLGTRDSRLDSAADIC